MSGPSEGLASVGYTDSRDAGFGDQKQGFSLDGADQIGPPPQTKSDADLGINIGLRQSHSGGHMKQADAQTKLHEAHFYSSNRQFPALLKATEAQPADPDQTKLLDRSLCSCLINNIGYFC